MWRDREENRGAEWPERKGEERTRRSVVVLYSRSFGTRARRVALLLCSDHTKERNFRLVWEASAGSKCKGDLQDVARLRKEESVAKCTDVCECGDSYDMRAS